MVKLRRNQSTAPKGGKFRGKRQYDKPAVSDDEMSDDVDPESREYMYDEVDDFHDNQEKMLLSKGKKLGWSNDSSDEEEGVFGLESSDEEDEGQRQKKNDDEMASDIEDVQEEGLPNLQAWGQRRRGFYNTDFVDQDYSGITNEQQEAADLEEKEAKRIQKKLTEQLDEADFGLDFFPAQEKVSSAVDEPTVAEEIIKADLTQLSKREKLELLKKDSPEFLGLVDEFKEKMSELRDKLHPVIKEIQAGTLLPSTGVEYIKTKYHLILNYCTNISFYLLLKAKRVPVHSHPVIKRLFQFKNLLEQLTPVDAQMEPQLQNLLQQISEGTVALVKTKREKPAKNIKKKKQLKLLSTNDDEKMDEETAVPDTKKERKKTLDDQHTKKKAKKVYEYDDFDEKLDETNVDDSQEPTDEQGAPEVDGKRAITYEMSKNKGLMPCRKKEQRNPRVKNRMKFRKAEIRRKGQVRKPRTEVSRYGGEISGIKIGVSKSIKFK